MLSMRPTTHRAGDRDSRLTPLETSRWDATKQIRRPRRDAQQALAAAALFMLGAMLACAGSADQAPALPNIVLVLADDMGYGDVGVYNLESRIPTPPMDLLVRQGIQFTEMHSADSVCTPSRYGLLTGLYCWRTRLKRAVLVNCEPPLIEPYRLTPASLLKRKGYANGMFGKRHLGLNFAVKEGRQVDFD